MTRLIIHSALIGTLVALQTPAAAQPTQPPPACAAPEHRQFDFWVGYWDVYPTAQPETKVANSLIERLYGGCTIGENWRSANSTGGSASFIRRTKDVTWRSNLPHRNHAVLPVHWSKLVSATGR